MSAGWARPRRARSAWCDDSALFQPDIENIYGEYDPELAKSLLDEIGLPVGADGMRTFPDGSELILVIEGNSQWGQDMLDGIELVAENWRAVGLNTQVEPSTRDLYWPRAGANEVMIATWTTDRGLVPMIDPIYQFPFDERSWMAPAYGIWYKTVGRGGRGADARAEGADGSLYDQYQGRDRPRRAARDRQGDRAQDDDAAQRDPDGRHGARARSSSRTTSTTCRGPHLRLADHDPWHPGPIALLDGAALAACLRSLR